MYVSKITRSGDAYLRLYTQRLLRLHQYLLKQLNISL
ncbi:hypothetical protein SAMN05216167_101364 [Spirosoma endophyticum]|uniref:Uncharacterized protein n=1 Tax=Spirosoma endophyticum TaxID=662367 RepID=A0A1I1G1R1_9BACT|nr:hypothetical protein SAMN05216167_101364 [Spirosoma endophyticum]